MYQQTFNLPVPDPRTLAVEWDVDTKRVKVQLGEEINERTLRWDEIYRVQTFNFADGSRVDARPVDIGNTQGLDVFFNLTRLPGSIISREMPKNARRACFALITGAVYDAVLGVVLLLLTNDRTNDSVTQFRVLAFGLLAVAALVTGLAIFTLRLRRFELLVTGGSLYLVTFFILILGLSGLNRFPIGIVFWQLLILFFVGRGIWDWQKLRD